MKKVFIAACSLLLLTAAKAQTQKGNVMVGANLAGLGLDFQDGNTTFSFNLNPKAGWFIKDNLAIGPMVNFGLSTQKNSSSVTYGVGAFGRKYFGDNEIPNLSKSTKWFGEVNAGINGINTKTGDIKSNTNGLGVGIGPGLAYFINPNIALEGLVKYNLTVGFGNSTTNNNIGFGLGFQIYLNGKQARQIATDPLRK